VQLSFWQMLDLPVRSFFVAQWNLNWNHHLEKEYSWLHLIRQYWCNLFPKLKKPSHISTPYAWIFPRVGRVGTKITVRIWRWFLVMERVFGGQYIEMNKLVICIFWITNLLQNFFPYCCLVNLVSFTQILFSGDCVCLTSRRRGKTADTTLLWEGLKNQLWTGCASIAVPHGT